MNNKINEKIASYILELKNKYDYAITFKRDEHWECPLPKDKVWLVIDIEELYIPEGLANKLNKLLQAEKNVSEIKNFMEERKGNVI